jgi:hypothetical protein
MSLARHLRRSARSLRDERLHVPRRAPGARGEGGAVLILAMVFMIVVAGIVGVLANSVSSHLEDSAAFTTGRNLQYAATSAVDLAIQNIRYNPFLGPGETLNASPPSQCWNPNPNVAFSPSQGASSWGDVNGEPTMDVWCSTVWNPTSAATRIVTISACEAGPGAAQCAQNPSLQEQVIFDDYPQGVSAPSLAVCSTYCGSGQTIESSLWSPKVPALTDLQTVPPTANNSGSIAGGTAVKLQGTGFVAGATTVNFVQEVGGTANQSSPLAAVTPTFNADGSITATTPAVTTGTTYFVTVTTPTGTSSYCNLSGSKCFVFTYSATQNAVPTVSGISVSHQTPAKGTTNGGDLLTIAGTDFYGTPQVNFIPAGGGASIASSSVTVASSGDSIAAITPGIISGTLSSQTTTYNVQVVTAGGSSGTDPFEYLLQSPIVAGISTQGSAPTTSLSGTRGTLLTISGASFYSGASVLFYNQSSCDNGSSIAASASAVTVISPSSVTVTVPSTLSNNTTYCVAVSTASVSGASSYVSSNAVNFSVTG